MEEARKNTRDSQADVDRQRSVMEANRREIKKAEAQEEKYASIAGQYGMKDTKYTNAADFARQRKIDEIKRTHANYKNFNSSGFRNSLSQEEKAAFSREQQLHERHKKVGRAAAAAGMLAGGAAGTVIGAFGGEKGMKAGAMMGGFAGGGVAAGTAHLVTGSMDTEGSVVQETGNNGKTDKKTGDIKRTERRMIKNPAGVKKAGAGQPKPRQGGEASRSMRPGEELDRRAESAVKNDPEINKLL